MFFMAKGYHSFTVSVRVAASYVEETRRANRPLARRLARLSPAAALDLSLICSRALVVFEPVYLRPPTSRTRHTPMLQCEELRNPQWSNRTRGPGLRWPLHEYYGIWLKAAGWGWEGPAGSRWCDL